VLKLHLGPVLGKSFENLRCDALVDWQHYDAARLVSLAKAGAPVWPMIRRADATNNRHVSRFQGWRNLMRQGTPGFEPSHVLLMNEPFNLAQDGFTKPEEAAGWATRALAEAGVDRGETRLVLGGFLLTYSEVLHSSYAGSLRAKVLAFQRAFGDQGDLVYAFHPYFNEVPSDAGQALSWYQAQLDAIAADFPRFAITETPFLHSGYSYRERDVATMWEIMEGTWQAADERGCYAYGWYLATPNRLTGLADFVLCDGAGTPRPLGLVYRDLVSRGAPPEPTEAGALGLVESLANEAAYLLGYARSHPHMSNVDIRARLQDILSKHMEANK